MGYNNLIKKQLSDKPYLEKVAQSRWRKHIDGLQTEDDLYDFAAQSSRNKRQVLNSPGGLSNREEIGFDKNKMKRILSSDDGWRYEDGSIMPTNESRSLSDRTTNKIFVNSNKKIQDINRDMNINRLINSDRGATGKSTSMISPGSLDRAEADDLVSIIHGGNRAKAEAFVNGGNGFSQLQTHELLEDGMPTNTGLQFHSKNKDRASTYANMASAKGGSPAIIEAKIPRKYIYPNISKSPRTDEYGLPDAYFNKLQDIKVYNPETGQVYMQVRDNKDRLPYGRTKTPGSPSLIEKATKINSNRKDFTLGKGELISQAPSKEEFKKQIRERSNPSTQAKPMQSLLLEAPGQNPVTPKPKALIENSTINPKAPLKNVSKDKIPINISRNKKIALTGAALGAGIYGIKKLYDKKKADNDMNKVALSLVNYSFDKIASTRWQREIKKLISSGASKDDIAKMSNKLWSGQGVPARELTSHINGYARKSKTGVPVSFPPARCEDFPFKSILKATKNELGPFNPSIKQSKSKGFSEHHIKGRAFSEYAQSIRGAKRPATKEKALLSYRDMIANGGVENVPKFKKQLSIARK